MPFGYSDYKIRFGGGVWLDRPLLPQHAAYLRRFVTIRHLSWSNPQIESIADPLRQDAGLLLGTDGAFFVGLDGDQDRPQRSLFISMNEPPAGQPSLTCSWRLAEDDRTWGYEASHNLYLCYTWLQYLLTAFFIPWGYHLDGEITWQGDDEDDCGTIAVEDNVITHHLSRSDSGSASTSQAALTASQLVRPDEPVACVHVDATVSRLVCEHLAGSNPARGYVRWFSGHGRDYVPICGQCAEKIRIGNDTAKIHLRQICLRCYNELEYDGYWSGIVGQPEILVSDRQIAMTWQSAALPINDTILALQPVDGEIESIWIALTDAGDLFRVNFTRDQVTLLMHLPASQLDLSEDLSLHVSFDGRFAALANTFGQHGFVLDLQRGVSTMPLERDDYCVDTSQYPLAFFRYCGRYLLVHGTGANRVDISDSLTGELLSQRLTPSDDENAPQPEHYDHYHDYFFSGLTVSPDQRWIVSNGWAWQPLGFLQLWQLPVWLEENVWESENGPSLRSICWHDYWDEPLCWVNNHTLAIWGYGFDEDWVIPGVCFYDVDAAPNSKDEFWFAGPEYGTFVFADYLFVLSPERGLTAWDITSGERVGSFPDFHPSHYHRGVRQFLALDAQNKQAVLGTVR